jgi:hypothetical protein
VGLYDWSWAGSCERRSSPQKEIHTTFESPFRMAKHREKGDIIMSATPNALITDLLSTGYFFEELKNYSESKEIDLPSYSRQYAVPYLARVSESHERSGHGNKSKILNFAIKYLSDVHDDELVMTILELKKVASSEIDHIEKALYQMVPLTKSERLLYRQNVESAQWLTKLLVSIIRIFKLPEIIAKRDKSEAPVETLKDKWELLPSPMV